MIFVRRTEKPEETLLFVCNFVPVAHEKFQLGVPFAGKYKEILNSDDVRFGGSGMVNPRVKTLEEGRVGRQRELDRDQFGSS